MRVTICGSIAFINEMVEAKQKLEEMGHEVAIPPVTAPGPDGKPIPALDYYNHKKALMEDGSAWIWKDHSQRIVDHFEKVKWSDAILVLNHDKNGIEGYVGANTLMEMGLAFHLKKPIFLLNKIPKMSYTEEIFGMKPIVISGDFNKINGEIKL